MAGGRWDKPEVPHKGWSFVTMEDAKDASCTCEMCGNEHVRYVHIMSHPGHQTLRVGRICAEKMQNDYLAPRQREQEFKRRLRARIGAKDRAQQFLKAAEKSWWDGQKLKWYRVVRGKAYYVTVFQRPHGWQFRVARKRRDGEFGEKSYLDVQTAFGAALKFVATKADPEMAAHLPNW
jgi:hypothetical protein